MSARDQLDALAMAPPLPDLGVRVGELMALANDGATAIVRDLSRPDCALLQARTVVDLHADHIGQQVLMTFATGITERPVVLGVLRGSRRSACSQAPWQLDVNGERLVIDAKRQLVLRCGKASITLTEAGKVLIDGTYVISRSTGINRVKGGSVQLN